MAGLPEVYLHGTLKSLLRSGPEKDGECGECDSVVIKETTNVSSRQGANSLHLI